MSKRAEEPEYWEVWQGSTLICSAKQKMTEHDARNKVANEARHGVIMEARPEPERTS
jgi:hypothetical protein